MAASSSGGALKDLVHPSLNEALKTQNSVTFKLVKTGECLIGNFNLDVNKIANHRFLRLQGINIPPEATV